MGMGGGSIFSTLFGRAKEGLNSGYGVDQAGTSQTPTRGEVYDAEEVPQYQPQASFPQYIPGSALGYGNQGLPINPYVAAYFGGPDAALADKLDVSRTSSPDIMLGGTQESPIDYSKFRPETLMNPYAAGWKLYSKPNPFGADNPFNVISRKYIPAPEGSYTDSEGNVWVRG
jgi:hypothetical protein